MRNENVSHIYMFHILRYHGFVPKPGFHNSHINLILKFIENFDMTKTCMFYIHGEDENLENMEIDKN